MRASADMVNRTRPSSPADDAGHGGNSIKMTLLGGAAALLPLPWRGRGSAQRRLTLKRCAAHVMQLSSGDKPVVPRGSRSPPRCAGTMQLSN